MAPAPVAEAGAASGLVAPLARLWAALDAWWAGRFGAGVAAKANASLDPFGQEVVPGGDGSTGPLLAPFPAPAPPAGPAG